MSEPKKKRSRVGIIIWVFICLFLGLGLLTIVIPNYVKAHSTSAANVCYNYLREIDVAKNEWALKTGKTNGTVATEDDIRTYARLDSKGNFPRCPDGGVYTIGKVGENPTCSLGKTNPLHVLP